VLDGYATDWNEQQHVNYIGTDGHVHELFYDGSHWHHNDLSGLAGSSVSVADNNVLDGYATNWNEQQHVNYIGTDGHVHELFYDGSHWHDNDLTNLARSSTSAVNYSTLDGYPTDWNEQQHVNYLASDGGVHELYYDGSHWHDNDLSELVSVSAGT
jgi:hypothetical protein